MQPLFLAIAMTLWLVRGGRFGEQEQISLENDLSCIGFYEVPDLSKAKTREDVFHLLRSEFPQDNEKRLRNFAGQLNAFANRMKRGDLVVLPLQSRKIAIGEVIGEYQYRTDLGEVRHARPVRWLRKDLPRQSFEQDLLYSFGAFMTVCEISRNNAEERVKAVMSGRPIASRNLAASEDAVVDANTPTEIEQIARDQIADHVARNFRGHDFTRLVEAVLQAEGFSTKMAPPGPDGGVDIWAGKGPLGMDPPRVCVQVKSGDTPSDVNVLRALQGSMRTYQAEQGLLVSWGGFTSAADREAKLGFFSIRLWDAADFISSLLRNYDALPAEIQSELPLKQVWTLVLDA